MFQLHVVLDGQKNWLELLPPWITATASLVTVMVAVIIARNQNKIQRALAERQHELQRTQLE